MLNSISNQVPTILKQIVLPELTPARITNLALVALACIRFVAIPLAQRLFSKPVDEIKVRGLINDNKYAEAINLLKNSHDKTLWQKLILNVVNDGSFINDKDALSILEKFYIEKAPAKLQGFLYEQTLLFYIKVKPESKDLINNLITAYLKVQTKHLQGRSNEADLTATINHLLDVQKKYLESTSDKDLLNEEPKKKQKGLKKREPLLKTNCLKKKKDPRKHNKT